MAFNIQNIGHQIANDVKIQINREFLSKFPDEDWRENLQKLYNSTFSIGIGKNWYVSLGKLNLDKLAEHNIKMDISFKDRLGEYSESLANIFKISYCKLIIFAYNMFYTIQFYKMKYNF